MIKYEDYFPKTILSKCGISPETKLFSEDEILDFTKNKNEEDLNELIGDIYSNFKKSSIQNGNLISEFKEFNIDRRIVSMLCDLDVISSIDKEKYLSSAEQKSLDIDVAQNTETRVSIELPELDMLSINKNIEKSEKVALKNNLELEVKGKQK